VRESDDVVGMMDSIAEASERSKEGGMIEIGED
jgi:predicted transcriptional regulator